MFFYLIGKINFKRLKFSVHSFIVALFIFSACFCIQVQSSELRDIALLESKDRYYDTGPKKAVPQTQVVNPKPAPSKLLVKDTQTKVSEPVDESKAIKSLKKKFKSLQISNNKLKVELTKEKKEAKKSKEIIIKRQASIKDLMSRVIEVKSSNQKLKREITFLSKDYVAALKKLKSNIITKDKIIKDSQNCINKISKREAKLIEDVLKREK